jgi:hypothetical protein
MKLYSNIKNKYTDKIITSGEYYSLNELVLHNKNLQEADLQYADLTGADLTGADLTGADLTGADLKQANLTGANLTSADLKYANLTGANLTGANMENVKLMNALMVNVNLKNTKLKSVYFKGADLTGTDISCANLTAIRDDIWSVLCSAPAEVEGLRTALIEGRVNGSLYIGECACLIGTLANLNPNTHRPAEAFYTAILEGNTPDTSQFSKLAVQWIEEFLTNMKSVFSYQKN